jgi:hypothetical protein
MRTNLGFLLIAAVLPGAVYAARFEVINSVAYPPPIYTLLVMLFASSIRGRVIQMVVGATLQVVVFASLNSYLLSRRVVLRPLAVWLPSTVVLITGTLVQVSIAGEVWMRQDYAGARTSLMVGFGALALGAFLTLFGYRASRNAAPRWALSVNCLVHCAIVAVLFPYVGELP